MAKLSQLNAKSSKIETLKKSKLLTNIQSNTPQIAIPRAKATRRGELRKVADEHQKQHAAILSFPKSQKLHAAGGMRLVMCVARLEVLLPGAACPEELREVANEDLKQHAALDLKSEQ